MSTIEETIVPAATTEETRAEVIEQRSRNLTGIVRDVWLPYLGTRIVLVLIGIMADFYLLPVMKSNPIEPSVPLNTQFPQLLWLMWRRFDAGFYIDIAEHGYWAASTLNTASNWIFHPLYPLLIFPFGYLFGGSDAAFDIGAVLVSNVAGLIAITYLYLLVRREFNSQIAARTIFYLALFPTSFYLSAAFSESVFLACAVMCIYYARQHRWWLAGICGGLGSLARIQGLALLIPVIWEYWQVLSEQYAPLPDMQHMTGVEKGRAWLYSRTSGLLVAAKGFRNWLHLVALSLIPLGLVPFFIYSQIQTGDFLASIHNHSVGWDRQVSNPVRLVLSSIIHPLAPNAMEWNFWALNMVMIFVFIGFTIWAFRSLPIIYALYTFVMMVMPLSTGSIKSISRYYLIIFPAFMLLALWSSRGKSVERNFSIVSLFAPVMAICMVFFVLGLPLIA
ncbi:MAG TPA: glycosyltransferase family 39 protein [Ktedonobacteraceae bacterium]|nr:glycosyltransferase family 39 protein [Ktedonobacteraceae bacterium]